MGADWKQDLPASLVVFLVALPLCMGIALASGAPVATGLVTAIIGGLVVGLIAGAPLQVSGPAAGLTVVCAGVISQYGVPALGIVVLIAGGVQLVAGLFRLGQWFRAVSPAVVHGMLSGIGVLIVAGQLHVMVDHQPHGHGLSNLAAIPESVAKGLPLPEWEDAAARRVRIELLKSLSQLHERQDEIERNVARVVTRHGSAELHKREEDQLPAFVPAQDAVLSDLQRLREEHLADSATLGEESVAKLESSFAAAEQALHDARADLEQHRLDNAETSQHAASEAIRAAQDSLESHPWAGKLGVIAIVVIVAWKRLAKGRLALIPPPLVAVLATVALAWALSVPVLYVEIPDNLVNGLTFPSLTVLEDAPLRALFIGGLTMAAIASAETLLCATAVDRLHNGPRTQYDRELCAQGIGNMLCGLVGALPMTGVIVRSAANVKAGAKSRLSTILHGVWMLLFVLLLASLLRLIPVSVLAGMLVYIGFQLIDFKGFFRLWKESRSEAFILLVTLVVIVVEDLLMGVLTGVALSAFKLLFTLRGLGNPLQLEMCQQERRPTTFSIGGAATFLRLPILARELDKIPQEPDLHIDISRLEYVDHACFELIVTWSVQRESQGGQLTLDWGRLHARLKGPQQNMANGESRPAA